jgi:hypothetical protein
MLVSSSKAKGASQVPIEECPEEVNVLFEKYKEAKSAWEANPDDANLKGKVDALIKELRQVAIRPMDL